MTLRLSRKGLHPAPTTASRALRSRFRAGRFREDLFFRLEPDLVWVPPLRERRDDIPLLARHFLHSFADEIRVEALELDPEIEQMLQAYDFPGNVRELRNGPPDGDPPHQDLPQDRRGRGWRQGHDEVAGGVTPAPGTTLRWRGGGTDLADGHPMQTDSDPSPRPARCRFSRSYVNDCRVLRLASRVHRIPPKALRIKGLCAQSGPGMLVAFFGGHCCLSFAGCLTG